MQNVIDVSNHILKYSQVYTFEAPVTDLVKEEALQLCLKHGEEFVILFIENYLNLMMEELYERNWPKSSYGPYEYALISLKII